MRGDLSKWLCEINTGVYVGNVSSRVRDALWNRVCENIKNGSATMVFSASGEQKMDFRVHNTAWEPVDLDGIQLMRRPNFLQTETETPPKLGFSNASKQQGLRKMAAASAKKPKSYVVIDLETTGLDAQQDEIIEFGALLVKEGEIQTEYSQLVKPNRPLPKAITNLTGITEAQLQEQGRPLPDVLEEFLTLLGTEKILGYHLSFDMEFLRVACQCYNKPIPTNSCVDLLPIARKKLRGVRNYHLATLAEYFSLDTTEQHRALVDCKLIHAIYQKVNEK